LRSAKGQWIPVFAYSGQSLLCCTAVSPSSGAIAITPTEAAVPLGSASHTKYASYRRVINEMGKEAISTGIMFTINDAEFG
jgi:hypothetical protein